MHKVMKRRMVLMIGLLVAATAISQSIAGNSIRQRRDLPLLRQVFTDVRGWPGKSSIPIGARIVSELNLDDYLFRNYGDGKRQVTLYIGLYRTAAKVGAAHDPLVCFQGQGWRINDRGKGAITVGKTADQQIAYATMVAERESHRELIIYWFQTGPRNSDNTFNQKLDMIWQRFTHGSENNAFVRVSAPIDDASPHAVKQMIFDFIVNFYPQFFNYVSEG